MPRRLVLAGLRFFGTATAVGIAVVVLAPIGGVRLLGLVGSACAALGFVLQLHALHRVDPQALEVLRSRFEANMNHAVARARRVAAIVGAAGLSASPRPTRWPD